MARGRWPELLTLIAALLGFTAISEAQVQPGPVPTATEPRGPGVFTPGIPEKPSVEPPPPTVPSTRFGLFPSVVQTVAGPGVRPRATFEFHPSISLSEEYTDNFNLSSRDKEENFRTLLGIGLSLSINGARTRGQIDGGFESSYDTSTDKIDYDLSSALSGDLTYEVNPRLRITARDLFTRSDDPLLGDGLGLRREREQFTLNTFSLAVDYLIASIATREYYQLATFFGGGGNDTISHTAGLSLSAPIFVTNTVGAGYEFVRSDTSEGGSDVTGHSVNAFVSRQLNPSTVVGLSGSYEWRNVGAVSFVDETGTETSRGTDYRIGSVSLFLRYVLPQRWSVSTSVGYSRLYPDIGGDESSVTTDTVLTYQLGPLVFTLRGTVGFSETFAGGENFGVVKTRGVSGSIGYPFTPFVSGLGQLFYRHNKFEDVVVSEANRETIGRTEDAWGGSVGLTVRLLRWLSLVLEYTYTNADSSVADRDYTENRARASLTATF